MRSGDSFSSQLWLVTLQITCCIRAKVELFECILSSIRQIIVSKSVDNWLTFTDAFDKYILYQLLLDFYSNTLHMADLHFYQSNISTSYLYFYLSMTVSTFTVLCVNTVWLMERQLKEAIVNKYKLSWRLDSCWLKPPRASLEPSTVQIYV